MDPKSFLKTLTTQPGVYQMYDAAGHVLYVGKARNLKKRVSSYFQRRLSDVKVAAMVAQVDHLEVIVTQTENEALLLENNLIKKLRPRYNVLFRDDKSYPYLFLSQAEYPRLDFHRGPQRAQGTYFGPYPSSLAVRELLNLLQKLFHVRQCDDVFFKNRSRPCLQYFIQRCSAPCVKLISPEDYQRDVQHVRLFLENKSAQVIEALIQRMEIASEKHEYEQAAFYRDQIATLRQLREKQYVTGETGEVDVITVASSMGTACVQLLMIRGGRLLGSKSFFSPALLGEEKILSAFVTQYYQGGIFPQKIILAMKLMDQSWLEVALSAQAKRRIKILAHPRQALYKGWLKMAMENAKQSLVSHLSEKESIYRRFEALQAALKMENLPQRIECFDVSHTQGEATVASCVVFDHQGPAKTYYRRYNITGITPGDDYAALTQAVLRRYTKVKQGEGTLPDVLLIDGGKGQRHAAEHALEEVQVSGVLLVAVAKGEERKPGKEVLHLSGQALVLPADSPALHLIQQVRDEAHRFAITAHRQKRAKARRVSPLENLPGIGVTRRRALLRHLGGLQEVMRASVEDLARVPGISHALAQKIFDLLHAHS